MGNRSRTIVVGVIVSVLALSGTQSPPSSASAQRSDEPAQGLYAPTELLVRFWEGVPEPARARVRDRYNLEKVRDLPLDGLELTRLRDGITPPEKAIAVEMEDVVRYAQPNHLWRPTSSPPNDPGFSQQWGLHNTGQTGGASDADIDAPEAWSGGPGSAEVVVAVIDTGVDVHHPDIAENIWSNPGETGLDEFGRDKKTNGVDDDDNVYIDDVHGWDFWNGDNTVFDETDGDIHGTHVAGIIAASRDNSKDVAGISNAHIMSLKFLGPDGLGGSVGYTSDAILALDYAIANGAHLTNNSWGGGPFEPALRDKIEHAHSAGQLFVAAAGNDGINTDDYPQYPSSYDLPNIISVAATTDRDTLAGLDRKSVV